MSGISAIGGGGISFSFRQSQYVMNAAAARTAAANPARVELPVQPVRPVTRIPGEVPVAIPVQVPEIKLPGSEALNDPGEIIARTRIQYPEGQEFDMADFWDRNEAAGLAEAESPAQAAEDAECQTCKNRRYQDGSDDPGVSFKLPTKLTPQQAEAAVRAHEHEHVVRERAKAEREGREVVSQSVSIYTGVCPECGKVYVSGGETVTVTAEKPAEEAGEAGETGEAAA